MNPDRNKASRQQQQSPESYAHKWETRWNRQRETRFKYKHQTNTALKIDQKNPEIKDQIAWGPQTP